MNTGMDADRIRNARRALLAEFDRADTAIRALQPVLELLVDVRAACVESLRRLDAGTVGVKPLPGLAVTAPPGKRPSDIGQAELLGLLRRTGALAEADELLRRADAGDDLGPVHTPQEVDDRLRSISDGNRRRGRPAATARCWRAQDGYE